MPSLRRLPSRRALGATAGVVAAVATLTACQKPIPKISVLSGSTYRTISPSTYCFDVHHCTKPAGPVDLPVVTAQPDGKVLIDVPRALKYDGWSVRALSLNGAHVLGTSGRISGTHSYEVASTANGGQPFIVQVQQYHGGAPDQSAWSFLLRVSGATGSAN